MEPEIHLENPHFTPLQSSLKLKGKFTENAAELFQSFTFTAQEHKIASIVSIPIHEVLGSLIGVEIKYKDEIFSCHLVDNSEAFKSLSEHTFFNDVTTILDRTDSTKPILLFSFRELFPTQVVTITLKYIQEYIFNDNHIHLFIPKESLQFGNSLSLMLEFPLENIASLHSSPELHRNPINNNSSLHYEGENLDKDILLSVTLSSTAIIYSPIAEKDSSLNKIAGRATYVPETKTDRPYHFEVLVDALDSASTKNFKVQTVQILNHFLLGLSTSVPHTFALNVFGETVARHSETPCSINEESISSATKFLEENLHTSKPQFSDLKSALEKVYSANQDGLRVVLISNGGFQDVSGVSELVREKSSVTPVFSITPLASDANIAAVIAVARESGGRVEFILGQDDLEEKSRRQATRAEQDFPPEETISSSESLQVCPAQGPFNTLWRGERYSFYFLADENLEGNVTLQTSQGKSFDITLPGDLKTREQSTLGLLANKQVLTETSSFVSVRGQDHALICSKASTIRENLKEINVPADASKDLSSDLKMNGISSGNGECGSPRSEDDEDGEGEENEEDDENDENEEENQNVVSQSPKAGSSKLVYEPDFLLSFQNSCTEKPAGLDSTLEIILGNQIPKKSNNRNKNSGGGGDRGNYKDRGGNRHRNDRSNKRNNSSGNHSPTTNNAPVQLAQSENAWKRPSQSPEELDQVQRVLRKLQGILNKLTLENFGSLLNQIIAEVKTAEILEGTISLVFDKALSEPHFSKMYVDLCITLSKIFSPSSQEMGDFRRVLLSKCQEEFEKTSQQREQVAELIKDPNMSQDERDEKVDKVKRRALGNVKFIGELFKGQMLSSKVMHECIIRLLGQDHKPNHDDLEALCKLLTTIGQDLEKRFPPNLMDDLFKILLGLSDSKELPNRFRFMLKDLIDLRKNDWVPRIKQEEQKLIKDIHKDAKQQELKKESQRRENDMKSMSSNTMRRSFDSASPSTPGSRDRDRDRDRERDRDRDRDSRNQKTPLSARSSAFQSSPSNQSAPPPSPHSQSSLSASTSALSTSSKSDDNWETAGPTKRSGGQSKSGQSSQGQAPNTPSSSAGASVWSKVAQQSSANSQKSGFQQSGKKGQPQSPSWKHSSEGAALKSDQSPRSQRFGRDSAQNSDMSGGNKNVFNLLGENTNESKSARDSKSGNRFERDNHNNNKRNGRDNQRNQQQSLSARGQRDEKNAASTPTESPASSPANNPPPAKTTTTTPPESPLNLSTDSTPTTERSVEADLKEIETTLKEFLITLEDEEAVQSLKSISSSNRHLLIQEILNVALDGHEAERKNLQSLFGTLLQEQVLSPDETLKGINLVLESIEDIELDNPLVINYFGQFIGRAVAGGHVSFSFLDSPVVEDLIPVGKAAKLLLEIFDTVNTLKGIDGIKTIANESKQDFNKYMKPGQTIDSLVQANPSKGYLQALQQN